MTRSEAVLELQALVSGLPGGTVEERTAKASERLASHDQADVLRGLLVELAIQTMVEARTTALLDRDHDDEGRKP